MLRFFALLASVTLCYSYIYNQLTKTFFCFLLVFLCSTQAPTCITAVNICSTVLLRYCSLLYFTHSALLARPTRIFFRITSNQRLVRMSSRRNYLILHRRKKSSLLCFSHSAPQSQFCRTGGVILFTSYQSQVVQ